MVWDLNKIGTTQSLVDSENGPVELIVKIFY